MISGQRVSEKDALKPSRNRIRNWDANGPKSLDDERRYRRSGFQDRHSRQRLIILPLEPRTFINPNSVRESGGTADVAHSVLTVLIRCRVNLILGCFQYQRLLTLDTVKMAQLALPAFIGLVRGTGCHPRRSKSNHRTGPFAANAAFCRLIVLQVPSSQLDMAEACGSRTHPRIREGHGPWF